MPWGILTVFIVNLIPMAIAAILAVCLYRYLLPRDFPLVIADCAARKGRVRTLAFLFVFFSIFQFVARSVPQPVMDATVRAFLKYPLARNPQDRTRRLQNGGRRASPFRRARFPCRTRERAVFRSLGLD